MPAVSQKRELSPLDEEPKSKKEHSCKFNSPQSNPLSSASNEAYDVLNSLSLLISSGRTKESKLQKTASLNPQVLVDMKGLSVCIEVYGRAKNSSDIMTNDDCNNLLIEKWLLQSVPSDCENDNSDTAVISVQFLTQAVKSFLYFSQINSWTVSNGGELPFNLLHRVYSPNSTELLQFSSPTETHNFPIVPIDSLSQRINVSVMYLSRLEEIPSQLLSYDESVTTPNNSISVDNGSTCILNDSSPLSSTVVNIQPTVLESDATVNTQDSSSHQLVVTGEVETNDTKLLLIPSDSLDDSGFPFSPPNPSPLSHKLMPSLSPNHITTNANSNTTNSPVRNDPDANILCHFNHLSLTTDCKNSPNGSNTDDVTNSQSDSNNGTLSSSSRIIISKFNKAGSCSIRNSITSTSVNGNKRISNYPETNILTGMRPPGASSPIPFQLRRHTSLDSTDKVIRKKLKRRSCGIYSKSTSCPPPPTRSMSLPAVVPNLCLLGTFEESVLNGRIDPLGYVEGFTAELGASGSFCPQHITLPVTTSFFSLSDDGGPSQYLGHIDLSGLKKRAYRIPRKGTVQLALFNPNKTVVKIFVIIYNHSDMPPNTTTFIRQKTQSRPSHSVDVGMVHKELVLPSLQYLIHLRFLSSKCSHVYLHTDIKILFARRAPDVDPDLSKVSLYTMHEGPLNPKYGPLTKELC